MPSSASSTDKHAFQATAATLPTEILAEIFLCATSGCYYNPLHEESLPYAISFISSRWRAVALSTPSLWSRLELDLTGGQPRKHVQFESVFQIQSIFQTWIGRCRLLDIRVFCLSLLIDWSVHNLFIDILGTYSSKWERFVANLYKSDHLLICLQDESFPHLRTLDIRVSGSIHPEDSWIVDDFEIDAPSLTNLSIATSNGSLTELYRPSTFPLSRLTSLSLRLHTIGDEQAQQLSVMRTAAPSLTKLALETNRLGFLGANARQEGPTDTIIFPCLQKFDFTGIFTDVLNALKMPILQTLSITPGTAGWDMINGLIRRSACQICNVGLDMMSPVSKFSGEDVKTFLGFVSHAQRLTLRSRYPERLQTVLEMLRKSDDLLPDLTNLELHSDSFTSRLISSIVDTVQGRADTSLPSRTAPIRDITLGKTDGAPSQELQLAVERWEAKGIRAHLVDNTETSLI